MSLTYLTTTLGTKEILVLGYLSLMPSKRVSVGLTSTEPSEQGMGRCLVGVQPYGFWLSSVLFYLYVSLLFPNKTSALRKPPKICWGRQHLTSASPQPSGTRRATVHLVKAGELIASWI